MAENGLHIKLRYCVPWDYLLRATWTAAEILKIFQEYIESFELEPGLSGEFEFSIDGNLAYSKKQTGEFPTADQLIQSVFNAVNEGG